MAFAAQLDHVGTRRGLLAASLVVIVLLLYAPTVHYGFLRLWDDDAYVTDNPYVRNGLTLANIRWAFTSMEQSNWHPLAWLSHMLDCQLFGLNPGPQHLVNLLLHAANVFLLFWLLRRATGAVWRSYLVAALFAVHPLNVETVAWIAQRKSLLSAFFSLLAIAAYGSYVQRSNWKKYALLIAGFALALMAKPMAVTLPLLLLLLDFWPLKRLEALSFPRRLTPLTIEKLPLLLMSAASSLLTARAQNSGGSVMHLSLLPVTARIENALISYVAYLGKLLWPARLAAYYPIQLTPHAGEAIASLLLLLAITAAALYFRKFPYLAVGWFFYLLALIPVIGIVQVGFQGVADRYMYVPAVGLFIALVWGFAEMAAHAPAARVVLPFAAFAVIIALATATVRYLECWSDPVSLFAQVRASWGRPDFWIEQLYGNALFSAGRSDEALEHYAESCAIQSRTEHCHYNIAHILAGRGQYAEALREYQLALRYTASRDMALLCLDESAETLLQMRDFPAAQAAISQALAIDPTDPMARHSLEEIAQHNGGTH